MIHQMRLSVVVVALGTFPNNSGKITIISFYRASNRGPSLACSSCGNSSGTGTAICLLRTIESHMILENNEIPCPVKIAQFTIDSITHFQMSPSFLHSSGVEGGGGVEGGVLLAEWAGGMGGSLMTVSTVFGSCHL